MPAWPPTTGTLTPAETENKPKSNQMLHTTKYKLFFKRGNTLLQPLPTCKKHYSFFFLEISWNFLHTTMKMKSEIKQSTSVVPSVGC